MESADRVIHPFPPVVDEGCRLLILGSFPSVKSREEGFFYGHPQNRFWRMLGFGRTSPLPRRRRRRCCSATALRCGT